VKFSRIQKTVMWLNRMANANCDETVAQDDVGLDSQPRPPARRSHRPARRSARAQPPIQAGAQAIHGITDVADAPGWAQVAPELPRVIAGRQVLYYNAAHTTALPRGRVHPRRAGRRRPLMSRRPSAPVRYGHRRSRG
jgi:hypothetical protein